MVIVNKFCIYIQIKVVEYHFNGVAQRLALNQRHETVTMELQSL